MNMNEKLAERYVSAVERQADLQRKYADLAAAQLARERAKRQLDDAEYWLRLATASVDEINDPQ